MDPKQTKKEMEWADRTEETDDERPDEKTYRDGSVQHECWAENGYTRDDTE